MNAKTYLGKARWLKDQITRLNEKIYMIRSEMTSTGAMRYDKIAVQSSPDGDPLVHYIDRLAAAERRMVELQVEYYETYGKIQRQIGEIEPDLYRQILTLRYLDGLSFPKIADRLGYSYDYIRNSHGKALKTFSKRVVFC